MLKNTEVFVKDGLCRMWGKQKVSDMVESLAFQLDEKLYSYGNVLRPPHSFMPPWEKYDPEGSIEDKKDRWCRHGIVYYKEPLTPEQVKKFELMPFGDEQRLQTISKELKQNEYFDKYVALGERGIEALRSKVLDRHVIHPSELDKVMSMALVNEDNEEKKELNGLIHSSKRSDKVNEGREPCSNHLTNSSHMSQKSEILYNKSNHSSNLPKENKSLPQTMERTNIIESLGKYKGIEASDQDNDTIEVVTESFSMDEINAFASEVIAKVFNNEFKLPAIELKTSSRGDWAARAHAKFKRETADGGPYDWWIEIQKRALQNTDFVKSSIAHELIHIWQYLNIPYSKFINMDAHGESFERWMNKINSIYGQDFVTKRTTWKDTKSKEYYLFIKPTGKLDEYAYATSFRVTQGIKDLVKRQSELRVVRTDEPDFENGRPFKRGGPFSVGGTPEKQAKLKELYNSGKHVAFESSDFANFASRGMKELSYTTDLPVGVEEGDFYSFDKIHPSDLQIVNQKNEENLVESVQSEREIRSIRYHVTSHGDEIRKDGFRKTNQGGIGKGGTTTSGNLFTFSTLSRAQELKQGLENLEKIRISKDPLSLVKHSKYIDRAREDIQARYGKATDRQVALYLSTTYAPYTSFDFDGPERIFEILKVDVSSAEPIAQHDDEEIWNPEDVKLVEENKGLNESVQSEREIRSLAKLVLASLTRNALKHQRLNGVAANTSQFSNSMEWNELQAFLNEWNIQVILSEADSNTLGSWVSSEKTIHLSDNPGSGVEGVDSGINRALKDAILNNSKDTFARQMENVYLGTLVHELTHAFDDYRSKGKFKKDSYKADIKSKDYWLDQIEINARFAETSAKLRNQKVSLDDGKGFESYMQSFRQSIQAWEDMPEWVQKRLTGRMYQEYSELSKEEKNEILVKNAYKTLNSALKSLDSNSSLPEEIMTTSQDKRLKYDDDYTVNQVETLSAMLKEAIFNDAKYSGNMKWVRYLLETIGAVVRKKPEVKSVVKEYFGLSDEDLSNIQSMDMWFESVQSTSQLDDDLVFEGVESRGYPTFDEYLTRNNESIRSIASEYGFYEPEDYVREFGNLVDASDYEDEYDYSSAWEEKFEEIMKDRFKDLERRYERLPSKIILYRSVRLKDLSKLDRNNLGVYWTDNYDSAQSYLSYSQVGGDFVIKAEFSKEDIDWDFSIRNNLNLHLGDQEQEINIKDDTDVKVLDVFDPENKPTGTSFIGNAGKIGPGTFRESVEDLVFEGVKKLQYEMSELDLINYAKELKQTIFNNEISIPPIKIVSNMRAGHLGRALLSIQQNRRTGEYVVENWIEIQRRSLQDEQLAKSILAHEMIHIWQHQQMDMEQKIRYVRGQKSEDAHGASFATWADRINKVYGDKFVEVTGGYTEKAQAREYYFAIMPSTSRPGAYAGGTFVKMTPKTKAMISHLRAKGLKIVKTNDADFVEFSPLTQGMSIAHDAALQEKIKTLYTTGAEAMPEIGVQPTVEDLSFQPELTEDFKTVERKFLEQGIDQEEINRVLADFKVLKNQNRITDLQQKNIDTWGSKSFEDLKSFIEELKQQTTKTQEKKLQKMEGAELVTQNDEWFVYEITTHKAAQIYGSGTKWCITQADCHNWNSYITNHDFYFLISKTRESIDPWYKIAMQVNSNGQIVYWDATDKSHVSLHKSLKIPQFKYDIPEKKIIIDEKTYTFSQFAKEKNLEVEGHVDLSGSEIISLPEGLKVGGNLNLRDSEIIVLPEGLTVGRDLYLYGTRVLSLPEGLTVGRDLDLERTDVLKLPEGLSVGRTLTLSGTRIEELPEGLSVGHDLDLRDSRIKVIPKSAKIGGKVIGFEGKDLRESTEDLSFQPEIVESFEDREELKTLVGSLIKSLPREAMHPSTWTVFDKTLKEFASEIGYQGFLSDFIEKTDPLLIRIVHPNHSLREYVPPGSTAAYFVAEGKRYIEVYVGNTDRTRSKEYLMTTLVHELTHLYDDVRSGGKYAAKDIDFGDDYDAYLRQPHEIHANYNEVLSTLEPKDHFAFWKNFKKGFTDRFEGWNVLDKKIQNKLLAKLFVDFEKGKQKFKTEDLSFQPEMCESGVMHTDLDVLVDMVKNNYGTRDYYLSNEADDEWNDVSDEWDSREEWAQSQDEFNNEAGNPAHYFISIKSVSNDTWLIHFTDSDPKLLVNGFKGVEPYAAALTSGGLYKPEPGDIGFAFDAESLDATLDKYGKHAIIFQSRKAVKAYHVGDEEYQVMFDTKSMHNFYLVYNRGGRGGAYYIEDIEGNEIASFENVHELQKVMSGLGNLKKEELEMNSTEDLSFQPEMYEDPALGMVKKHLLQNKIDFKDIFQKSGKVFISFFREKIADQAKKLLQAYGVGNFDKRQIQNVFVLSSEGPLSESIESLVFEAEEPTDAIDPNFVFFKFPPITSFSTMDNGGVQATLEGQMTDEDGKVYPLLVVVRGVYEAKDPSVGIFNEGFHIDQVVVVENDSPLSNEQIEEQLADYEFEFGEGRKSPFRKERFESVDLAFQPEPQPLENKELSKFLKESEEHKGKVERKVGLREYRKYPGDVDLALGYAWTLASKQGKSMLIIPGNSYGAFVYHIQSADNHVDAIRSVTVMKPKVGFVYVRVDPEGNIYRIVWEDKKQESVTTMESIEDLAFQPEPAKVDSLDALFQKTISSYQDKLKGGMGDKKEPKDFDMNQVKKGFKVEFEHTNDPQLALEITLDHLSEIKDYYDRLEKIEKN